jgi:hypothetical protein
VIRFSRKHNTPLPGGLPRRLMRFYWAECVDARLSDQKGYLKKIKVLIKSLRLNPWLIFSFLKRRFHSRVFHRTEDNEVAMRHELRRLCLDTLVLVNDKG